ncbi:MAG: YidH family protein [Moraxellaceae bacterium]
MSELNDPRVFFAAERTLLAWNRTSLALMAFGFVIERFGLFMQLYAHEMGREPARDISFWMGMAFILLACGVSLVSARQYRRFLLALKPVEIPDAYRSDMGALVNVLVALLGLMLAAYLCASAFL